MKRDDCYIVTLLNCYLARLLSCFSAIILVSLLSSHFSPKIYAQEPEAWKNRCVVKITPSPSGPEIEVATIQGLECVFVNIVRVLVPLVGLAFFIMLVVGSFQMITAGGEAKQVQKARHTLTYAIFGFILFFGIWFILLLIKEITGVDVTKFVIPG